MPPSLLRPGALVAAGLATTLLLSLQHQVHACAVVSTRAGALPSPAVEQVLVVFDEARQREHFVREISFRQGETAFGFLVPSPGRPEVEAVPVSPFAALNRDYPFRAWRQADDSPSWWSRSKSAGPSRSAPPDVTVLEQKRIGSFDASVLAATDAGGLRRWLDEHSFATTPATESWLQTYVRRGFHFTAFVYRATPDARPAASTPTGAAASTPTGAATGGAAGAVRAETVRVSFSTPVPYYPYDEPDGVVSPAERVLATWVIAPRAVVPVSAVTTPTGTSWKRPFRQDAYGPAASPLDALRRTLGGTLAPLLPAGAGDLQLQRFEDQKRSRPGWGDIVFLPAEARTLTPAERAALVPFAPLLDPSLETTP